MICDVHPISGFFPNPGIWIRIRIRCLNNAETKLQEKPSALKREHPALKKGNLEIYKFFLFLWVILPLLDPDPVCGSGSRDPIKSGSYTDPDPQH